MSFLTKEISLPRMRTPKRRRAKVQSPSMPTTRLGLRRRSSGRITGLEITATQVVAAEAHLAEGRIVADRVVIWPLRAGLVRDGLVMDREGLADELRQLFSKHKFAKRVRVGLATPRTVLRMVDLPPVDESEVAVVLPMLAKDTIPMPLESAVLDHQVVGLVDTPEGRRLRVIVVATEREGVATLADTLQRAGLRTEGIDLSVFATIRAIAGAEPASHPVLFAQLGDMVNLAISENGTCRFTRQAPQGLALIVARLADQRDITTQAAHTLLWAAAGDNSGDASDTDVREVGALLSRLASELGAELRTAAEFYATQFGTAVHEVIVTGPLATLRGFVDALADVSGMSVSCGEVATSNGSALVRTDACIAPVAVGLAVGRVLS